MEETNKEEEVKDGEVTPEETATPEEKPDAE